MTDDRSERLRRRRKQSKAQANDQNAEDEPMSNTATHELSKQHRSTDDGVEADEGENSVKEEQIGTYMYLPESQTKELRRQYNVLKAEYEFEYDEEFQKNRHFYPLVVQYGLESLEEMDPSEIRDSLQRIM